MAGLRPSSLTASGLITVGRRSTRTSHTLRSNAVSRMSRQLGQLANNAKPDQTKVEFNFSSIGGQNESRVNAESQTAAPKNQEPSRCRSQAGQTPGEAGIGGARRGERKKKKRQTDQRRGWAARNAEKNEGRPGK